MTKVLSNKDLFEIYSVLEQCVTFEASNKFYIYLYENLNIIKSRIDTLNKLKAESKEIKMFVKEKYNIAKKYCELDDKNNIILYVSDTSKVKVSNTAEIGFPRPLKGKEEEFNKLIEELNVKYKDVIEEHIKKINNFNDTLTKKVEPEIKFVKIPFDLLPDFPKGKGFLYTKILIPIIDYNL